jgi:hypothetical protein
MIITTVPLISEIMMLKSPLYGHYEESSFDLYKEVMSKSKDRSERKSGDTKKKE